VVQVLSENAQYDLLANDGSGIIVQKNEDKTDVPKIPGKTPVKTANSSAAPVVFIEKQGD
jgi:hypothetical protein